MSASPSDEIQGQIVGVLRDAISSLGHATQGLDLTLRPIPLEGAWGFGSAVAFSLRKFGAKGTPAEIAQRVADALPKLPQIERVEVVNNYINFFVDKEWYANRIVEMVLSGGPRYGCLPDKGERVMVEYANLNTHKAMHVGHLRNVVLGATIYNILKCAGYSMVGATYLGDIGMHVIRTLWAYTNFFQGQEPETERGSWLEQVYVDATSRLTYRNNVTELITEAAKSSNSIGAHLSLALQALSETDADDAPFAREIALGLVTREGPDWKRTLAARDHIVLNLWYALGGLLLAQPSSLDATNADAANLQPEGAVMSGFLVSNITEEPFTGIGATVANTAASVESYKAEAHNAEVEDPLASLRADYERLDSHMAWWDEVPRWQEEIREMFARWEAEDPALVAFWRETREWSLDMFRRIFRDLGISFDAWFFESDVEIPGKKVVDELIERGLAEDHRATGETVIVRVDDQLRANPELSKKYEKELFKRGKDGSIEPKDAWRVLVVLRSDGTSLYATKDLELARRKFDEYKVDRSVYVIDTRQSMYFQQVFRVLELWGFRQADKSVHLGYEMVTTPSGAISSRRGGAPLYEDLEREALLRARAIVDTKEAEQPRGLTEEQKASIAHAVAYGALKMG
ncbi:MAG: arginine--tRNA ligase, partial [Chloroflexota bacterium]|nr:arginine--tRNA ligase [Chloroflexota bacterium]